jgi:hypothetical protein
MMKDCRKISTGLDFSDGGVYELGEGEIAYSCFVVDAVKEMELGVCGILSLSYNTILVEVDTALNLVFFSAGFDVEFTKIPLRFACEFWGRG